MEDWTIHKRMLTNDGMSTLVFDMLQEAKRHGQCFQFMGSPCCRKAFLELSGIGVSKLQRIQAAVESAAHDAPRDLRHSRLPEPTSGPVAARFFTMLWEQGEPYAADPIGWTQSGSITTTRSPPSITITIKMINFFDK